MFVYLLYRCSTVGSTAKEEKDKAVCGETAADHSGGD